MKKTFLSVILLLTICSNAQTFDNVIIGGDEFQGEDILPNASIWNNEIGKDIRNNELQFYTARIKNQVLKGGNLQIIGEREDWEGKKFTSASLTSKEAWKYGKIEGRIKMQTGMGIWGCFWTLGQNSAWPQGGEIDIIEHINSEDVFHSTVHWWNESLTTLSKRTANGSKVPDPIGAYNANEFQKYSIEWTPKEITWFLNDTPIKTFNILNGINGTGEFHTPHFILLNCPIGGSWPQGAAGTSWNEALIPLPNKMEVDYVRVYKYISNTPPAPTGISAAAITQTSFDLRWNASAGATKYDVILENKGIIATYGPFSTTSCTIPSLKPNTNYSVRIKSRNVTTNNSDYAELSDPTFVTTAAYSTARPIIDLQFNENKDTIAVNTGFSDDFFELKGDDRVGFKTKAQWSQQVPANNRKSTSSVSFSRNRDRVQSRFIVDELIGVNDITITGWLNCKSATETNASGNRIVNNSCPSWFNAAIGTDGIDLVYRTDGSLQLGINEAVRATSPKSTIGKITTDAAGGDANWKFFAVTYSATSQSVKFYFGNSSTNAILDKEVSYNRGALGRNMGPLAIGNFNSITTNWQDGAFFNGLIDQVQIYNSSLNESEIIKVQQRGILTRVATVSVTPLIVNLATIGATSNLTATITPTDASNKTVHWSSSDTNVAIVDNFGQVTAMGTGKATVTAKTEDGDITSASVVTVNPIAANMYEAENGTFNSATGGRVVDASNASGGKAVGSFNQNSALNRIYVNAGSGGPVDVTVRYSNATRVNQTLTYFSFDSNDNQVRGNKVNFPPTANENTFSEITFQVVLQPGVNQSFKLQKDDDGYLEGPILDKYTLSFQSLFAVDVTGVTLNQNAATINVNTNAQLTATVNPVSATNKAVTWTSNNTSVAVVSNTGLVIGKSLGSATITATTVDGGKVTTAAITVVAASSNLALNKPVTASTTNGSNSRSLAVDGNNTSRWESTYADLQWIYVDLGARYDVNRVKISWEYAYGSDYLVQVSADASNWTTIKSVTGNTVITNDFTNLIGTGRYVRIYATKRATVYGYSIYELEVYGTLNTTVNVTGVTLNQSAVTVNVNANSQLTATVNPVSATNKAVTWTSNRTSVATVSNTGLVTGKSVGSAT
ncbi:MAG: hypothetical protein RL528_306, partial [Bacteroidota bacterium]